MIFSIWEKSTSVGSSPIPHHKEFWKYFSGDLTKLLTVVVRVEPHWRLPIKETFRKDDWKRQLVKIVGVADWKRKMGGRQTPIKQRGFGWIFFFHFLIKKIIFIYNLLLINLKNKNKIVLMSLELSVNISVYPIIHIDKHDANMDVSLLVLCLVWNRAKCKSVSKKRDIPRLVVMETSSSLDLVWLQL